MSDLSERLRHWDYPGGEVDYPQPHELMAEAADRIKELEANEAKHHKLRIEGFKTDRQRVLTGATPADIGRGRIRA